MNILEKQTSHLKSVSLTKEEMYGLSAGKYSLLKVSGPTGKFIRQLSLTENMIARLIDRSVLLPTRHVDKETGEVLPPHRQAWFYVVNLP